MDSFMLLILNAVLTTVRTWQCYDIEECYQSSRHSMYAMISVIEIQCLALLMTIEEKSYDRILKFLLFDYLVKFNSLNKCNVIGIFPFPFPSSSDLTNN